eukprot:GHVH01008114.1.p1 GENE.GHVH01008114.1~~GHVH01008114.1.p1  ORF type:complete len:280 (-),score=37.35 GHVH01008114.1:24-863(-)
MREKKFEDLPQLKYLDPIRSAPKIKIPIFVKIPTSAVDEIVEDLTVNKRETLWCDLQVWSNLLKHRSDESSSDRDSFHALKKIGSYIETTYTALAIGTTLVLAGVLCSFVQLFLEHGPARRFCRDSIMLFQLLSIAAYSTATVLTVGVNIASINASAMIAFMKDISAYYLSIEARYVIKNPPEMLNINFHVCSIVLASMLNILSLHVLLIDYGYLAFDTHYQAFDDAILDEKYRRLQAGLASHYEQKEARRAAVAGSTYDTETSTFSEKRGGAISPAWW